MKLPHLLTRFALLLTTLTALSLSAVAQDVKLTEKEMPPSVLAAFKSAYPNATIHGYAKEKENGKLLYEIESMNGKTSLDVVYNEDGSLAAVEEGITTTDLPADAQRTLRNDYPKAVVRKAEKVTEGDKISYEVSAKQGKKRISLEFDASGKVLHRSVK